MSIRQTLKELLEDSGIAIGTLKSWKYPRKAVEKPTASKAHTERVSTLAEKCQMVTEEITDEEYNVRFIHDFQFQFVPSLLIRSLT